MGQGTDTCNDRPTEVSVIRFVSRNRTIEEIAPKKEVYICKQRGCGKIFTNHDEYKTHEALEALKIRFICREPGCGEELSDPGSMWRHYQEWHNNETNVFACPYTNCGSVHTTSNNLEEHIENSHRQPPTLPTEPEIICFEGPDNTIDEDATQNSEDSCYEKRRNENFGLKGEEYNKEDENLIRNDKFQQKKEFCHEQNKVTAITKNEDYSTSNESLSRCNKFSKNEDLLISNENFLTKYDASASKCGDMLQVEISQEKNNVVYINGDVTITKNMKNQLCNLNLRNQEHRIDLGNLERVFRSGFERETAKIEENTIETVSNCSDDEEYTPKKQRMSRCKMPGCGAQVSNVTGLWKHYQDNHANSKPPIVQATKSNELFRCEIPGCETEFNTTLMLYKHFNDVHSTNSISNTSTNTKTGSGSSFHFAEIFQDDTATAQTNFKTDFKAKHNVNLNDYVENGKNGALPSTVKEESRD